MSTRANKVTAPQGQEVEVETFFKGKLRQASRFFPTGNYKLHNEWYKPLSFENIHQRHNQEADIESFLAEI